MSPHTRSPGMLILAYLPFLGLIALLASRDDREVRWHAKNGQLLFAAVAVVGVVATAVGILVPPLSCLYGFFMLLVAAIYAIIVLLAVIKALQGERVIVPGISRYADQI